MRDYRTFHGLSRCLERQRFGDEDDATFERSGLLLGSIIPLHARWRRMHVLNRVNQPPIWQPPIWQPPMWQRSLIQAYANTKYPNDRLFGATPIMPAPAFAGAGPVGQSPGRLV